MSVSVVRVGRRRDSTRVKFVALEGPLLVLLEADSEADAQALCAAEGFEFVCLCDD